MGSKRDDDDVDADDDSTGKHRLRRLLPRPVQCFHWLLVIVILALFFGAYGAVFGAFRASGSSPSSANFVGLPSQTGFTAWQLKVLSQTYGYSAQLQFTPISFPAGFTSPDGRLISNSIGVSINGVQYSFAAGTLPGIITQDIGYDTGDSQEYKAPRALGLASRAHAHCLLAVEARALTLPYLAWLACLLACSPAIRSTRTRRSSRCTCGPTIPAPRTPWA